MTRFFRAASGNNVFLTPKNKGEIAFVNFGRPTTVGVHTLNYNFSFL